MTSKKQIKPIKVGDDLTKSWVTTNELIEALENLTVLVESQQQRISTLEAGRSSWNFFPFCIYEFPYNLRDDPEADDWRKVRVRAGTIFINGHKVEVTGTDGATNPFRSGLGDLADFSADILCEAEAAQFWFWIEITAADTDAPAAEVKYGKDDDVPVWDSTHIPIGYVDTNTNKATFGLIIHQYATTHLFTIVC